MCLFTQNIEPLIASEDIKVRKYLTKNNAGQYVTPIFNTPVTLGKTLIPTSPTVTPELKAFDFYSNPVYEIHSGVIHAAFTSDCYYGSICVEAIIPKGTKFWIDTWGIEVAARKLLITNKVIDTDESFLSPELAKIILAKAPKKNNIQIGDFVLIDNTFVSPNESINIKQVRGQVCGFYDGGTPMICAIKTFQGKWDEKVAAQHIWNVLTRLTYVHRHLKYAKLSTLSTLSKLELFQICRNYRKHKNERWYFGSIEENTSMLHNILYLNAARIVANIEPALPVKERYWSASELDRLKALACTHDENSVLAHIQYKGAQGNVIPFFDSEEIRNPLQSKIRNLVTKFYKFFKIK